MIRYKPTRVTLGESDVHDCLERLFLRHTRFVERQEQDTDQSDSENNESASVDSNSFSPYAYSDGFSCDKDLHSLFSESPSRGSWQRNRRSFSVSPSIEAHSLSPSEELRWSRMTHRKQSSSPTSADVERPDPLIATGDYQSFVNTDYLGLGSLSKGIHWQSPVKPLVACCAEPLYHSLKAHSLFSFLSKNSLSRWENSINTAWERARQFFVASGNHPASEHSLCCYPRGTNISNVTLPAAFSADRFLADNSPYLEEGITTDNTGHAPTLPKSASADADFELRAQMITPRQFQVPAQSPDCLTDICLDENPSLQASPMTEPARKTLKTTEGSKIDTSVSPHGEQVGFTVRHNKGSDAEPQISEAELPHKACDAASLDITSSRNIRTGSGKRSSSPLPEIIDRNHQGDEYDMASNVISMMRHTHSHRGTPNDDTAIEPPLPATQIEDGVAEPNALMFSKEEMDRIGAMLYREADAALRCLVSSQCEGAPIVEPDLMVSTSPKEHNGQDNLVDPHGGRLEPAGNEREPSQHVMRASVQFQNQVNTMMAELYHQVEDKAEDFGLASLRRKPLGEWYKGT
ncbi:hypothetical protein CA14_002279 [Aspergillus flavus]|uniref:Uncharacterized protein n=1 Tax=Aspergillus flavus TaxID=5059 RepID=A0AB74CNC9_ASPFL|nr:hypothetical protein CA14_002279 [Aspergillus flavus]